MEGGVEGPAVEKRFLTERAMPEGLPPCQRSVDIRHSRTKVSSLFCYYECSGTEYQSTCLHRSDEC